MSQFNNSHLASQGQEAKGLLQRWLEAEDAFVLWGLAEWKQVARS